MGSREVEVMVKKQRRVDMLKQHIDGRLTVAEVATILEMSARQVSRIKKRYLSGGEAALLDKRCGQGSDKRSIGAQRRADIVTLKQGKYANFTVRHFYEQAVAHEGVTGSYNTVRRVLQRAGVVEKQDRRGRYRRARKRQPMRGMRMPGLARISLIGI